MKSAFLMMTAWLCCEVRLGKRRQFIKGVVLGKTMFRLKYLLLCFQTYWSGKILDFV